MGVKDVRLLADVFKRSSEQLKGFSSFKTSKIS